MAPSPEMAAVADQLVDAARMQFGPSPLPYANVARWLIRHHLLSLSLSLSLSDIFPFVHNDGPIPAASGTIAAYIPISVWVVEPYPHVPPLSLPLPVPREHPFRRPLRHRVRPLQSLVDVRLLQPRRLGPRPLRPLRGSPSVGRLLRPEGRRSSDDPLPGAARPRRGESRRRAAFSSAGRDEATARSVGVFGKTDGA